MPRRKQHSVSNNSKEEQKWKTLEDLNFHLQCFSKSEIYKLETRKRSDFGGFFQSPEVRKLKCKNRQICMLGFPLCKPKL
jgi:hypothetical protein